MRETIDERKKKDIASFVQDGKVDWKRWNNLTTSDRGESYHDSLKRGVIDSLLKVGILSLSPEGNYRIFGGGMNLNPVAHMADTYFTSQEQARTYARALFSGVHYPVRIERIVDIEPVV